MKRPVHFIKRLSLVQQLLVIVVFTLSFFLFFFFNYLSANIDSFAENQMYGLIHRTQQNVIYNYLRNLDDSALYGASDPNIVHIIRTADGSYKSNGYNLVNINLLNHIKAEMDQVALNESRDSAFEDGSLYTVTSINSNATIATVIFATYQDEFKSTLITSVINMILIAMSAIFLVLILWVGTIIHPLNQIRYYIERLRRNEDVQLNIDREDEIGELANVLVEMNHELRRQENIKEEMIQNISHDLKTPIATIKSYGESIKDGVYPYETLEKSVDVIIEHANRLEKKVFNLLTLNRMDYITFKVNEDNDRIELREVIEQVIVSSKQIRPEIIIEVVGAKGVFKGLKEPWRIVVENLLDNAIRYADSTVIIEFEDDYLSVYNDGKKIEESRMKQLFKAYEIGEGGQFGLGLTIVNRVVTNYGYTISVTNEMKGVKFTIMENEI